MAEKAALSEFFGEIFGDGAASGRAVDVDKKVLSRVIGEGLSPRQREFIVEYYFERMTVYEIAERHGVGAPSVSRTLKRARENIFRALKYSVID